MKNLDRIRKEMSPERRRKIQARARALMAEEMTLRDLRTALARTQTTVGDILGIGQEGISRIEHRSDLLLSTLRSYVEAMGGNLSLIVEFPDREPVALSGIGFSVENDASASTLRRQPSELRGKRAERAARPHPVAMAKAQRQRLGD
jgi:Helix-turn-helix domain